MTLLELFDGIDAGGRAREAAVGELRNRVARRVRVKLSTGLSRYEDDIIQDITLQVITLLGRQRMPRDSEQQALAYLHRIVHSRIIDRYRGEGRSPLAEYNDDLMFTETKALADGDDTDARDSAQVIQAARDALHRVVDEAINARQKRWQAPLRKSYDLACAVAQTGLSVEALLIQRGDLTADAPQIERIRARDKTLQAIKRLREAILEAADIVDQRGDTDTARLARFACEHLLRRRVCQIQPGDDVHPSEGSDS